MENKITVQEFVDKYIETPERQRENYLKSLVVTDYIPFELKVALMYDLVQKTHMNNGTVEIKSPLCYALFMNLIIDQYTCINLSVGDSMSNFNLLNKNNIFNDVIYGNYKNTLVQHKEFTEFQTILNMIKDDFSVKYLNTGISINDFITKLNLFFDVINEHAEEFAKNIKK